MASNFNSFSPNSYGEKEEVIKERCPQDIVPGNELSEVSVLLETSTCVAGCEIDVWEALNLTGYTKITMHFVEKSTGDEIAKIACVGAQPLDEGMAFFVWPIGLLASLEEGMHYGFFDVHYSSGKTLFTNKPIKFNIIPGYEHVEEGQILQLNQCQKDLGSMI